MADPHPKGLLDTSVVIDLEAANRTIGLPANSSISSVTLAELSYGVALAADPLEAVRRANRYARVRAWFDPLPFDGAAAEKYGELAALVRAAGRLPRPRRLDLMIAATAIVNRLPLYTLNPDDFLGLESELTLAR